MELSEVQLDIIIDTVLKRERKNICARIEEIKQVYSTETSHGKGCRRALNLVLDAIRDPEERNI